MKANRLSAKAAKHAELMLMDTANGNQFIEGVRNVVQGADMAQPNAGGNAAQGNDRRKQLKAEMAKPEMQPGHPMFDRVKYDALEAEYRRVIGP